MALNISSDDVDLKNMQRLLNLIIILIACLGSSSGRQVRKSTVYAQCLCQVGELSLDLRVSLVVSAKFQTCSKADTNAGPSMRSAGKQNVGPRFPGTATFKLGVGLGMYRLTNSWHKNFWTKKVLFLTHKQRNSWKGL